jgi:hypothetical protein
MTEGELDRMRDYRIKDYRINVHRIACRLVSGLLVYKHLIETSYHLYQRCPTFYLIGQKLWSKRDGGQKRQLLRAIMSQ